MIKEKCSETWDIRWQWLQNKTESNQFKIYWDKGKNNKADYQTTYFGPAYHQYVRSEYILKGNHLLQKLNYVRGYVDYPQRGITQITRSRCTPTGLISQRDM